jgi:predicted ATP-grasp superfamily ATP-dependent carboligase/glycosyltransferase involved in cell wall biosynthesis
MSPNHQAKPGAVVIGASRRALSVVRSLGRHRIDTWLMQTDKHTIAAYSRYATRRLAIDKPKRNLVPYLMALSEQHSLEGWVLIPTDDDEVELFAIHHEQLSRYFRLGVPTLATVRWALDKRNTYALAAEHGIDHPRTLPASDLSAVLNADMSFPVVIKPAFRPRNLATTTPKAWRADNREELERVHRTAAALMPTERLMLQELIPGDGENQLAYAALCRDGEILASLAARRLRQWPREFGMASTFVETIDESELAPLAARLLAASGFTGLIELEFKRDPRDGRLTLLDANPRSWGWISVGPAAGVDFSYLLWRMLVGEDVPRTHGRPGARWVRMATDIPAAVSQHRHDGLSTGEYLRSLQPPIACSIFARDDPVPALIDAPMLAAIGVSRRIKCARRKVSAVPSAAVPGANGGRRRRALIIVENAGVPGDRRVWHESLALRRAGWEVVILAPHTWDEAALPDDEMLEGVRVRRFRLRPAEHSRLGYLREYGTAMWRIWREVRRLTRERPFDVIHASNPPDFLLLAAVGQRRSGTRLIFDQHDLAPEMYASRSETSSAVIRRALLALERLAFSLADVVLATNGSVKQIALARGRQRSEDVFVVRNGPMLERFTPLPPDPTLARGRAHLLVYVGLMGPQDGVDHALHALVHLHQRREDWHALFLGNGEMLPSLRELAAELGLSDHVEFGGRVTDEVVRRAVCSADVCLAPDPSNRYTDRSTLVKIAEYMALSRPTVSYDLTESRVTAGDAALFASNNDPAEFAEKIDELLNDRPRREALGEAGRARVERELAWEYSERTLLAAYQRALGYADQHLRPVEATGAAKVPSPFW